MSPNPPADRDLRRALAELTLPPAPATLRARLAEVAAHPPEVHHAPRRAAFAVAATAILAVALVALAVNVGSGPLRPTAPPPSVSPTLSPAPPPSVDAAGVARSGAIWAVIGSVLAVSPDNGSTWQRGSLPASGPPFAAWPFVLDTSHAWVITFTPGSVESGNGPTFDHVHLVVNRTVDGGQTWQPSTVPGDYPDTARSIDFVDARRGYLMVSGGRTSEGSSTILTTDDSGATWTLVRTVKAGPDGSLGSVISVTGDTTIWAAAQGEAGPVNHPILDVSRDAGRTWATVSLPGVVSRWGGTRNLPLGPPTFLSADVGLFGLTSFDPETTGDASGNPRTFVYATSDGGHSWSRRATLPFEIGGSMTFLNESSWLAFKVGVPSTLEATTDAGQTWRDVAVTGLPSGSFEQIDPGAGTLLVGVLLVGGNSGNPELLAASSDGGSSWQVLEP